jgi:phytoene desaturase
MSKTVVIIGGGLGGLAAACLLGKAGYRVTLVEKNDQLGGRVGQLKAEGYTFDTGPSWLLMPDVFERFFKALGEKLGNHLDLVRLDPSYRVFYKGSGQHIDITPDLEINKKTFEAIQPGSGAQLEAYLRQAGYIYDVSINRLVYRNYSSLADMAVAARGNIRKLHIFSSLHDYVGRYFQNDQLRKLFEYPAVFLGTSPYNLPANYAMLSHADFTQGVYYPKGGMYKLVEALIVIGAKHGVRYVTNAPVREIVVEQGKAVGARIGDKLLPADIVISGADRHFTETKLLEQELRDHSERYWKTRVSSPSAVLVYLGVDRQYDSLRHHNLLFSNHWRENFAQIFDKPSLPKDPSLYVCAPSKSDRSVAPKGHENLFVLVPTGTGLKPSKKQLDKFVEVVLKVLETEMGLKNLRSHITYKNVFALDDFETTFNTFRGSGLGLAHTFYQTAFFRPHNKSRKVRDLYFVGADTHPGIGMPTTLISAQLVYERIAKS